MKLYIKRRLHFDNALTLAGRCTDGRWIHWSCMNTPTRQTFPDQQPVNDHTYILRIWCAGEAQTGAWLASLEDPTTGERLGFSTLEQLFVFIMELSERWRGAS